MMLARRGGELCRFLRVIARHHEGSRRSAHCRRAIAVASVGVWRRRRRHLLVAVLPDRRRQVITTVRPSAALAAHIPRHRRLRTPAVPPPRRLETVLPRIHSVYDARRSRQRHNAHCAREHSPPAQPIHLDYSNASEVKWRSTEENGR